MTEGKAEATLGFLAMISAITGAGNPDAGETSEAAMSAFMVTAMLEFEASLQLLAERACFLTAAAGTAIAVGEGERMVYRASSGVSVPEPGTAIDPDRESIRLCLEKGRANWIEPAQACPFRLTVPVMRDRKEVGVLELVGHFPFGECEQDAIARLAEMVNVALEHRDAAFAAEHGIPPEENWAGRGPDEGLRYAAPRVPPLKSTAPAAGPTARTQTCISCGFPVSNSRTLCLDCEQKPCVPPAQLFSSEAEESWLSAHGYLLASLLVSVLAALIIYWLRR